LKETQKASIGTPDFLILSRMVAISTATCIHRFSPPTFGKFVLKKNPLDSQMGHFYRSQVLKVGGVREPQDIMKSFLGEQELDLQVLLKEFESTTK